MWGRISLFRTPKRSYHDLKDSSVSGFFRFLARVGDNRMNMQIVRMAFADGERQG